MSFRLGELFDHVDQQFALNNFDALVQCGFGFAGQNLNLSLCQVRPGDPAGPRRRFWGAGQRLNARDVTSIAAVITLQPITSRIAPESIMARSGIRPDP